MAETVIRSLPLPKIRVEDILRAEENDSARSPRQSILALYEDVLLEAATLLEPKALWKETEVEGAGEDKLYLRGGISTGQQAFGQVCRVSRETTHVRYDGRH
ncbi:hypothetical protein CEB3_c37970 [Peptococcaceae bacterium CEB3]|nr:hypothetical protein CEB3_c37970 [Peptococcaceae bacterium CEB3]